MLDLPRLRRIRLSARPLTQQAVAVLLWANYGRFPGVDIVFEGAERIPSEPVVFAMNHTDRFNYFPFQYRLLQDTGRFTATWVKGKYYENVGVGMFMELTNNLPTVSRGYVITRDFLNAVGRKPSQEEYATLRALVEAQAEGRPPTIPEGLPRQLLEQPRDMLGRAFEPARESWPEAVDAVFHAMMARFVALHEEVAAKGLDLLVFPQGTRSKRLSRGRIGMAQIALWLGRPIVPVGCSGSDQVYPGEVPWAKAGRVVYRFGEALRPADFADVAPTEAFTPFTAATEREHGAAFQEVIDRVMQRIDGLVDEEYRFSDDQESEGVRGTDRFV
jgi:1-acyl-sn-glycerol-3-phosphate acyltransferase